MGRQVSPVPFATTRVTVPGPSAGAHRPASASGCGGSPTPPLPASSAGGAAPERQVSGCGLAAALVARGGRGLGAGPPRPAQWVGPAAAAPPPSFRPPLLPSAGPSFLPAPLARFVTWGRASRPAAPPEDPGSRPRDGRGPGAGEVTAGEAGGRATGAGRALDRGQWRGGPRPPGTSACAARPRSEGLAGRAGAQREKVAPGRAGGGPPIGKRGGDRDAFEQRRSRR